MPNEVIVANNLPPIGFVAGTDQRLYFTAYDSASAIFDLTGSYCFWAMSSIDNPTTISASAIGYQDSGSPEVFYVDLASSDTDGLSGVFIQQPIIVVSSGSYFRPGQGKITIFDNNG